MAMAGNQDDGAVRYYDRDVVHARDFSVCTLVARPESYARLRQSFLARGFSAANTEFLAADNREGNQFDGYSWYRRLFLEACGKYLIFCHDDIELLEAGYAELLQRLAALTTFDPDWALAGNAGGRFDGPADARGKRPRLIRSIQSKDNVFHLDRPFARVESLDENFVIMRREKFIGGSFDLAGFHLYGPDICLMAEISGARSYVIDFLLAHHGGGSKGKDYRSCRRAFVRKYARYFPDRRLRTTTGIVQLAAP